MKYRLKNKRILIFLRSFEIGGAERQATMLANYLTTQEGARVYVWAYSKKGPIVDLLDKKVKWKSIPFDIENQFPGRGKKRKWDLFKLAFRIRLLSPDLIMSYTVTPNVDCGFVWKWTGANGCIWNQRDEQLNFLDKEIEKRAFKKISFFVSNSHKGKKLIEEKIKSSNKSVYYIPNAVFLNNFKNSGVKWRKKLGINKSDFVAVMIANLTENKDHENLLKAWEVIVKTNKNKKKPILILAGRHGSTFISLRKMVKKLGIEEWVRMPGFISDMDGLLNICDIGVFSSNSEGCPNGILECMATEKPVVATNIKGNCLALGRDNFGIVPTKNPEKFAEKILFFLDNEKESKNLGKKNKQRVVEFFNPKKVFESYLKIIRKII